MGKRVLLDENVPRPLRHRITGHSVSTVAQRGWSGVQNGELVRLAEPDFDVLVTADQNLSYQQNMKGRRLSLVVLSTNKKKIVLANVPQIILAVEQVPIGGYLFLNIEP